MTDPSSVDATNSYKTLANTTLPAYARSETDLQTTLKALITPIQQAYSESNPAQATTDAGILWNSIIRAVTSSSTSTINAESVTRLTDLVAAIKSNPPQATNPPNQASYESTPAVPKPNSDFNAQTFPFAASTSFGLALREKWNSSPPATSSPEWSAFNAYMAQLWSRNIWETSLFALWAFRSALEGESDRVSLTGAGNAATAEYYNNWIPSLTAGWLAYAAEYIYVCCRDNVAFEKSPRTGDPGRAGRLYEQWLKDKGQGEYVHGFSLERWAFWKSQLTELSNNGQGDPTVSELAKKGVRMMKDVETRS